MHLATAQREQPASRLGLWLGQAIWVRRVGSKICPIVAATVDRVNIDYGNMEQARLVLLDSLYLPSGPELLTSSLAATSLRASPTKAKATSSNMNNNSLAESR